MFKKIIVGVLCIMMVFSLFGCRKEQETFALDRVSVLIKANYQQEFENKEFSVEDFMLDNARAVIYLDWYSNSNIVEPYGSITIYLNNSGEQKVLDAIKHFKTLDFVKDAWTVQKKFALDRIRVQIKQEYKQQLDNKEFTVEDFEWDNIRIIIYQTQYDDSTSYQFIEVLLKYSGKEQILNAIEHFKALEFVENVRELEEYLVYDKVLVSVKSEFQAEFNSQEFKIEDFEWSNVERITYIGFDPNNFIEINLKKHGRDKTLDAMEYLKTLNFVREVNWATGLYAF